MGAADIYSAGKTQGESTDQMLGSYLKYMPAMISAYEGAVRDTSKSDLAAAKSVSSGYQDITEAEQLRATKADTDLLNTAGPGYTTALTNLQKQFDPEFYQGNADISKSFSDINDSYSLNGLSDGEAAAVERGNTKRNVSAGNLSSGGALTTLGNMQSFGDAFDKKRQAKTDNLSQWGSFNPSTRSGFNAGAIGSKDIGTGFKAFGSVGDSGQSVSGGLQSSLAPLANTAMTRKGAGLQALDAS